MKVKIPSTDKHVPGDAGIDVELPDLMLREMARFVMKMQTSVLVAMISDGSDVRDLLTEGSGYGSPMTFHVPPPIAPDHHPAGGWRPPSPPGKLEPHLALENKAMFYMALKLISAELDERVPPRSAS